MNSLFILNFFTCLLLSRPFVRQIKLIWIESVKFNDDNSCSHKSFALVFDIFLTNILVD